MEMSKSQKRRAENEVIFKDRNDMIETLAASVLNRDNRLNIALKFTCECADETCNETVEMTVDEIKRVRGNSRQFIIKAGHQQPDIEVVVKRDGYAVVEKFEEPPATDGKLNHTK